MIRFDPVQYTDGEPPASVLLHEVSHLIQTDVLRLHHQKGWLTEALCDYFAASWTGSPVLSYVAERYPRLSRTVNHRRYYPDDVLTEAG